MGDAQGLELRQAVSDAQPHFQPAFQQVVQEGHLLGHQQRMVEGQDLDVGAYADAMGPGGQHPREGGERGAVGRLLEMVLLHPDAIEAQLLHVAHVVDGVPVELGKGLPPLGWVPEIVR